MKIFRTKLTNVRHTQAGDTIVEVLIAIAICALIMSGAFIVSGKSNQAVRGSEEHAEALQLVQGQVERLRNVVSSGGDNTSYNIFCIDSSNNERNFSGSNLNTFDNSVYPAACLGQGTGALYNLSITRSGTTASPLFTVQARWNTLGSGDISQVQIIYRVYSS